MERLLRGELAVLGRIRPASNVAFLGEVETGAGEPVRCIYKPVSGEAPLWDFPHGQLAGRELASFLVSDALGWHVVPPTVLRDGPAGTGMVQEWQDVVLEGHPVDVVPAGAVPPGWHAVFDGFDGAENEVTLVHDDSDALRRIALFDVIANNADRKGSHVLRTAEGRTLGIDHGLTFHHQPKLRTVLWGWADEPLTEAEVDDVAGLLEQLLDPAAPLTEALSALLVDLELQALRGRCQRLLRTRVLPEPGDAWPVIPWPPI
ncbi:SCO1664 family protein [Nocardioidaceae bacterium]|nr:SCO1664 family protein [Nocardioidaceae bacterium]